jgi:hypothetical protein
MANSCISCLVFIFQGLVLKQKVYCILFQYTQFQLSYWWVLQGMTQEQILLFESVLFEFQLRLEIINLALKLISHSFQIIWAIEGKIVFHNSLEIDHYCWIEVDLFPSLSLLNSSIPNFDFFLFPLDNPFVSNWISFFFMCCIPWKGLCHWW